MTYRLLAALGVLVAVGAFLLFGRGADPYLVKIEFENLAGLRKNSSVKVGGLPGGDIAKVQLTERDTALATVELDPGVEIGPGARAEVRPVNLLGEKYIDLTPGDTDRALPSGSTIPIRQTSTPVELDDVLNTLRPDTRAAIRLLINEAGIAMAGRGTDFNTVLEQLPPAIDQTDRVIAALGEDTRLLQDLVERGDRVLAPISDKRADLSRLVVEAGGALVATAERRAELGATVAEAASTMRQLRSTFGELEATAQALVPASQQLRATAGPLLETLRATPAFVDDAMPLLEKIPSVAPDLARLGSQSTPTIARLRPTARRLAVFARQLAPNIATLDGAGGLDALLGLFNGWVLTTQNEDGLGNVFRLRAQFDETAIAAIADELSDPAARNGAPRGPETGKQPGRQPTATPVTDPDASATPTPDQVLPRLPKLPGLDLLPQSDLDEQLGDPQQTLEQTQDLLDFMLGK